jgi:hypothetical protein
MESSQFVATSTVEEWSETGAQWRVVGVTSTWESGWCHKHMGEWLVSQAHGRVVGVTSTWVGGSCSTCKGE